MAWASHQPKSEHLEQAQAPTKDMRPERHKALSHLGLEAQAQLGGGFVHEALESFCLNTECNHPQAPHHDVERPESSLDAMQNLGPGRHLRHSPHWMLLGPPPPKPRC